MTDQEGVLPSAAPADPEPESPDVVPAAAVSAVDDEPVGDRPARNIIAELTRKQDARFNELRTEILSALGSMRQPAPAQPQSRDYSDEELSQLATAGDARANDMLIDRKAARHAAQQIAAHRQAQSEQAQLRNLFARYPVLSDDSHPLTRYAAQVKSALLSGGHPNAVSTVISAITTAIADNPELAAQTATRMTSAVAPRPTVPTAAAATPTARRQAPASSKTPTLTDAQWTLAKRYGYKTREDAAKAIANHERRAADGTSKLGAVGAMIREDS